MNPFGQVDGVRAVLHYFRQQERGVPISIGSVYSRVTAPFVSPYVTSKFGLLGFMEALREACERLVAAVIPLVVLRSGEVKSSAGNVFEPSSDPATHSVSGGWRILPRPRRLR